MALSVALLVIDNPALPVDASWIDGNYAALAKLFSDCVGVVAFVGQQPSGTGQPAEE